VQQWDGRLDSTRGNELFEKRDAALQILQGSQFGCIDQIGNAPAEGEIHQMMKREFGVFRSVAIALFCFASVPDRGWNRGKEKAPSLRSDGAFSVDG
jgi:hypothetical protein